MTKRNYNEQDYIVYLFNEIVVHIGYKWEFIYVRLKDLI